MSYYYKVEIFLLVFLKYVFKEIRANFRLCLGYIFFKMGVGGMELMLSAQDPYAA